MSKKNRLDAILSLIEDYEIDTQEELTDRLIKMGFNVSQATVSRDINELNLIKIAGTTKKFRYYKGYLDNKEIPQKIIDLFHQITVSITLANNLIVIKTIVGNGSSAGMAVDSMKIPLILGSIAGDDTLLIITKNNADAEKVIKYIRSI